MPKNTLYSIREKKKMLADIFDIVEPHVPSGHQLAKKEKTVEGQILQLHELLKVVDLKKCNYPKVLCIMQNND